MKVKIKKTTDFTPKEVMFLFIENFDQLKAIDPVILWTYLVEHFSFKIINDWIAYSFFNDSEEKGLFNVKISQDMVDSAFKYYEKYTMQSYFANQLAPLVFFLFLFKSIKKPAVVIFRLQIIATNESKNFIRLVNRLSLSQSFFQYKKTSEFHSNFIQHALKFYPIEFLWSYLDLYEYYKFAIFSPYYFNSSSPVTK